MRIMYGRGGSNLFQPRAEERRGFPPVHLKSGVFRIFLEGMEELVLCDKWDNQDLRPYFVYLIVFIEWDGMG